MHEYEVRAQPLRNLCIESSRISESIQGGKIAFFADALMSFMYIDDVPALARECWPVYTHILVASNEIQTI